MPSPIHGYASHKRRSIKAALEQERKDAKQNDYLKDNSSSEVYTTKEVTQKDETPRVSDFETMNMPIIEEQQMNAELLEKSILLDHVSEEVSENQQENLAVKEISEDVLVQEQPTDLVPEELPEDLIEEEEPVDLVVKEVSEDVHVQEQPADYISEELPEDLIVRKSQKTWL